MICEKCKTEQDIFVKKYNLCKKCYYNIYVNPKTRNDDLIAVRPVENLKRKRAQYRNYYERYKEGLTLREIAARYKISHERVRQVLLMYFDCEYQPRKGRRPLNELCR